MVSKPVPVAAPKPPYSYNHLPRRVALQPRSITVGVAEDWDFGTNEQYPYLKHVLVNGTCGALQSLSCNLLLSHQDESTGLAQLILLGGARLVPAFDPSVLAYKVVLNDTECHRVHSDSTESEH